MSDTNYDGMYDERRPMSTYQTKTKQLRVTNNSMSLYLLHIDLGRSPESCQMSESSTMHLSLLTSQSREDAPH